MKIKRERMIGVIRNKYGLTSTGILSAMLQIPRHKFVPQKNQKIAYEDAPVPIGYGQTMSQPYTVAFMTDLVLGNNKRRAGYKLRGIKDVEQRKRKMKMEKVLEIGTGSGYQAAVLSKLFRRVYTVEIISELAEKAKKSLRTLGYKNVFVKKGSGEWGWKEKSPFDAIMITAGVKKVPRELFDQLKQGGVLVAPVGKGNDKVMTRFRKTSAMQAKFKKETSGIFHFVPFIEEGD